MNTLISVAELKSLIDQSSDVRVFDCRFSLQNPATGLRAYEKGHLPGAMFADMAQDLSTPHISGVSGRHPLPARAGWIKKVRNWGLHPQVQVVLYDDAGGAGAARMWWMLKWIGHDKVAVLNGGWQAWLAADGKIVTAIPKSVPVADDQYTHRDPLLKLLQSSDIDLEMGIQMLLDARDTARFRGDVEPMDPVAGHIPGAFCYPYGENLDADGMFKSKAELRARFSEVEHTFLQVVSYCGSGVTACHNVLAIVHAGLTPPGLYAGSWSEWITDPDRPVATGS